MRILIDTNIFIHLEDNKIMDSSYSEFMNICATYGHKLLVHPSSIEDISRDRDIERREIILSKINKYQKLESPPIASKKELEVLGLFSNKINDKIDNIILFALLKESVGILITEDVRLHKKAKRIGLDTRVLFLKQALHSLELLHKTKDYKYPNIVDKKVYNLDINEDFFDSLKLDYIEFSEWFTKISREARDCWVYQGIEDTIGGLIIYKEEMDPLVTNSEVLVGKTLKISTLKVADIEQGKKIGELFLKKILNYANKNNFRSIYLTTRENKQNYLINLIEDFGFKSLNLCTKGRDIVYVKKIPITAPPRNRNLTTFEYHKDFYPYIDCTDVKKHIIPIKPSYHSILFPELEKQQLLFYSNLQAGNTIKKIYLSHSRNNKLSEGDILLFYRSEDKQAITTIGIVELVETAQANDFNKVLEYSLKRSVYNYQQIMDVSKKDTLIILFRIIDHFEDPIKREWLIKNTKYTNCQSICELDNKSFSAVLQEGKIPYCKSI